MEKEEILKKAIDKAQANGFNKNFPTEMFLKLQETWYATIFSHDFAKAFWDRKTLEECYACHQLVIAKGDGTACCHWLHLDCIDGEPWQYHLQQMVLEENPIKYLEKFL